MKKILLFVFAVLCYTYQAQAQITTPGLIVNEVSQGPAGTTDEYMEFVVVGTRTCSDSTLDLRGWIIDDQNGWYATGDGYAKGVLRFANIPNWQAVPYGSIIILYDAGNPNPKLKIQYPSDDPSDANHDYVYVLPAQNTFMEYNPNEPPNSNNTSYVYPTTGFASPGSWSGVPSNNTTDAVIVVSPANLGTAYNSIIWGFATTGQTNTVRIANPPSANPPSSDYTIYLNGSSYSSPADYSIGVPNTSTETPGAGNNTANTAWINSMRIQNTSGGGVRNIYDTICQGDTVHFNGHVYNTAGIDTAIVPNPNPGGCDSMLLLHISFRNPQPTAVLGQGPTMCNGTDGHITLTGLVPGVTYTVNYNKNSTAQTPLTLVGDNSGDITIPNLGPANYSGITIYNGTCTPTALPGTVTLSNPSGPASPTAHSNTPLCIGQTVDLTANTTSSGATYGWTGPNGFTSPLQNPTIPNAPGAANGAYMVTITINGCTFTDTLAVSVSPILPAPSITSNSPVCNGDTLQLGSFSTADSITYNWSGPNGFNALTENPVLTNITPAGAGVYSVYLTAPGNCRSVNATTTVVVTVIPTPVIHGDSIACEGTTLQLSGTDSMPGVSYTWYLPNNTYAYTQNISVPNVDTTYRGTYGLYATLNGCISATAHTPISVNPIPAAPVTSDTAFCQYADAPPLTAIGINLRFYITATGGIPYNAPPAPSTATPGNTIFYVSQLIKGCESPRTPMTVTINPSPDAAISVPDKSFFCQHDTMSFFTNGPTTSNTYTWTIPPTSTLLNGSLQSPGPITLQFDSAGSHDVHLSVSNGKCTTNTVYLVQVNGLPNAGLVVKQDACPGESIGIGLENRENVKSYTVTYQGASLINYDPDLDVYYVKWNTVGSYVVTASLLSDVCPTGTISENVTVHSLPDVQIQGPSAATACTGQTVPVSAINPVAGYIYNWEPARLFPDGTNQGADVMAVLETNTLLYLSVTDGFGCTGTDSLAITSEPCCTVSFPTAFTPNNDGLNDVFRPITLGNHKLNTFTIENRYGQRVYESRDEKTGWNGKLNGVDQPIGTYYYFIKYLCSNGKEIVEKGSMELVR